MSSNECEILIAQRDFPRFKRELRNLPRGSGVAIYGCDVPKCDKSFSCFVNVDGIIKFKGNGKSCLDGRIISPSEDKKSIEVS
jgi:hypothetical protein